MDTSQAPPDDDDDPAKSSRRPLMTILNDAFAFDGLLANRIAIEDVAVTVAPAGVEVAGFAFVADTAAEGRLGFRRLTLPCGIRFPEAFARTRYTEKQLRVEQWNLGGGVGVEQLQLSMGPRVAVQERGVRFALNAGGGAVHCDARLGADALSVSLDGALPDLGFLSRFDLPVVPATISKLAVTWRGDPTAPTCGGGTVHVEGAYQFRPGNAAELTMYGTLKGGRIHIPTARVAMAGASLKLDGASVDSLTAADGSFSVAALTGSIPLRATVSDVAPLLEAFLSLPIPALGGMTTLAGNVDLAGGVARLSANLDANVRASAGAPLVSAVVEVSAALPLIGNTPILRALAGTVRGQVRGIAVGDCIALFTHSDAPSWRGVSIDSIEVSVACRDGVVSLERFQLQKGGNRMDAAGKLTLSVTGAPERLVASVDIGLSALHAFDARFEGLPLNGALLGRIKGEYDFTKNGAPLAALESVIELTSEKLALGTTPLGELALRGETARGLLELRECRWTLGNKLRLDARATYPVADGRPPTATLRLNASDLAAVNPVLRIFNVRDSIAGAIDMSLSAAMQPGLTVPAGTVALNAVGVRFGTLEPVRAEFSGTFTNDSLAIPALMAGYGRWSLRTGIVLAEGRLKLADFAVSDMARTVATASFDLPARVTLAGPWNPSAMFPSNEPWRMAVRIEPVDLTKPPGGFLLPVTATGRLRAALDLAGTPARPTVVLALQGTGIRTPEFGTLTPADTEITVNSDGDAVNLSAVIRQKEIQPLTIRASTRWPGAALLQQALAGSALVVPPVGSLPIDVGVVLPPSSLAFVPRLVPSLVRLDGTAEINLRVGGTVANPQLAGAIKAGATTVRIASQGMPPISDIKLNVALTNNAVVLENLSGSLSGGTFKLAGGMDFGSSSQPNLKFRVQSDEVLVARDESLTVRVDSDLQIVGPLNAAKVSGRVWPVQTRFAKEIEFLPLEMLQPGRGAVAQRTRVATGPSRISLPPPFADWIFDVEVITRDADPIVVRGNLASGSVVVSLKLQGRGDGPWLDGVVRTEKFRATLPFSSLNVTRGNIIFSEDAPFEPELDIIAESTFPNNVVQAVIAGRATNPEITFNANPPLPQEDIVALLTTGSTVTELSGNAQALASRAAIVVVEQKLRKWFGRSKGGAGDEKQTSVGDIFSRLQVDVGGIDARTGQPEIQSTFRLNDATYVIGEIGAGSGFKTGLRYLIRWK
jgi:autotransporter translocation and assembly factor TamB